MAKETRLDLWSQWAGMTGHIREDPREERDRPGDDGSTGTVLTPPVLAAALQTRPRAVIFDMDGLLVDSERTTRDVWRASPPDSADLVSGAIDLSLIGL